MLDNMRGSGQSKVMWVIMGLLMLGLTGFGIGGLTGGQIRNIGKVGEEPIEVATYARVLQNQVQRLNQQAGRSLSPSELQTLGLEEQVLDAVVGLAALNNETAQQGLSVGDRAVADAILDNPAFTGPTGDFDRDAYEFYLDRQLGISVAEFEQLLRKENARAILETSVVDGVKVGDTASRTLLDFAQQRRSIDWIAVTADALETPVPEPTQAQLEAYYDANADRYRSLRTRNITYAWLNPADLRGEVNIDDAELRESYDLQQDRFNKPETRAVDRLVFPSVADAEAALNRIELENTPFSVIVEERGLEEADIDMGDVTPQDLTPAAAEAVFAAEGPGVIGPVESAFGPALFRVNAIIAADNVPFEDAKGEIFDELAGEAARRLVSDLVTDIDDLLAAGATIEELGRDTRMVAGTIAFNAQSDEPITGYEAFREAARTVQEGDFPELIDLDDGGFFALRLDSIDEPQTLPLDEVRDRVIADWTQDETERLLSEKAESLQAEVEGGKDIGELGFAVTEEAAISRGSFVEALPPRAVAATFGLEEGGMTIVTGGDTVYLLRLTGITPFDPSLPSASAGMTRLNQQLDAQIGLDMLDLFSRAVQARADVQLNRPAINQINSQIYGLTP